MQNLIFKYDISNNILFDFLNKYCKLENEYYIFNKLVFKQYEFNNLLKIFYNTIEDYYKESKKFYIKREITYNNFLTIIRQICKCNNIPYYSEIKYDKNKYNIIYYIKFLIMMRFFFINRRRCNINRIFCTNYVYFI